MRRDAGTTDSIWPTTRGIESDGPLAADAKADVCVVGAGVVGLSVAFELMREGRDVIVLDDGPVGGGETARTTAHLVSAIDDRYVELESLFGPSGAQVAADSHQSAIDWTEDIVKSESLRCHWRRLDGYLFDAPEVTSETHDLLDRELAAARRAGVRGVEQVDRAPIPGLDTGKALRFAEQAELDPTAYLKGLVRVLRNGGARVHTGTHARTLRSGARQRIEVTSGRTVEARHVVEATNAPVFGHDAIFLKQAAYRTYCVAAEVRPGTVEWALYWDTADPYHYVRLRDSRGARQHLVVGGCDHRTGEHKDAGEAYGSLEAWMRQRWPEAGEVSHRWSGQVWEPVDSLAFIGRSAHRNVLLATGDSGNGWTHAPIAAMVLGDLVTGRKAGRAGWAKLYDPHRKAPKAVGSFLKETKAMTQALVGGLVKPGEVADVGQIAPGDAALVRRALRMMACYRDDAGRLHERSATCPHLGCTVNWNAGERTWDCPCHGSRYDRFGTVVNGPSNANLKVLDEAPWVPPQPDGVRAPRETEPEPRRRPIPRVGRKRRTPTTQHEGPGRHD